MKNLFFTMALASKGLSANANNKVPINKSIELQTNMILSAEKLSADEDDQLICLERFRVYVDGV